MEPGRDRTSDQRRTALLCASVLASTVLTFPVAAQTDGYFEIIGNRRVTNTEFPDGVRVRTEAKGLIGRISVNFRRSISPNVNYRIGGLFDRDTNRSDLGTGRTTFTRDRFRPFARISLGTEYFTTELFVERLDEKLEFDDTPTSTTTQQTYRFNIGWVPEDTLPQLRLEAARRNRFDDDRRSEDLREDTLAFLARYHPNDAVDTQYRGTFRNFQDRRRGTETDIYAHNLRVLYGNAFWNRRVTLNADYTGNYSETKTVVPGEGEFFLPTFPFRGLAVLDDTPEFGALPENPLLIDGDFLSPTGVDIGLLPPGSDDRPRNVGIDFGVDAEVDTVRVWVDQELPPDIVAAFSWLVYTSDDNLRWTPRGILPVAPFDRFENRFEIRFDGVTARYVKVVTSPLSPGVPDAANFPTIPITEVQGGVTRRGDDTETEGDALSHIGNLDSRARLFRTVPLYYEFNLFFTKTDSAPARYSVLNGISYSEKLGRKYTVSTRLSREDRQEPTEDSVVHLYSAGFSATPLETLRFGATVTARNEEGSVDSRDLLSFFVNSSATLYQGVELGLTAGRTATTPRGEPTTNTRELGASLTLVPHPTLAINLSYRDRLVESPREDISPLSDPSQSNAFASIGYRPLRALYFFASRRVDLPGGSEETRTQDDIAFSWTPFPDGLMRFLLSYGQTQRTFPNSDEESLLATLRWNIRPRSFFELSYRYSLRDSFDNIARNDVFSGRFRVGF